MKKIGLSNSLVSVGWLAQNLDAANLVLLDASMAPVFPVKVESAANEKKLFIPGALRFDFDKEICDKNTLLPHMMPSADEFTEAAQKIGIDRDSAVVVYDNVGVYASPRAWWMFRSMGHENIAVLNGGLPTWMNAGYETVDQLSVPARRGNFISQPKPGMFVDSAYVMRALQDKNHAVLDARSEGRFMGLEPEPRAGLRGGHMPNSFNIPFGNTLENGLMQEPQKLKSIFEKYGDKKMVFSCGSGVTSCVLALAAEQAGFSNLTVYDGSWSEWGRVDNGFPVEPSK